MVIPDDLSDRRFALEMAVKALPTLKPGASATAVAERFLAFLRNEKS